MWIHTAAGDAVANARLELYKVGDAAIRNNNLCFDLPAGFSGSGISLDNPDEALAANLSAHIDRAQLAPAAQAVTSADGSVRFDRIQPGMYLVRQNGFAAGQPRYSEIAAFVVALPMTQDDGWNYEIIAQPKVNLLPTPSPAPTTQPTDVPTDETLPQTGMLRWPVPVLGIGGLALFAMGWVLVFAGKRDRDA